MATASTRSLVAGLRPHPRMMQRRWAQIHDTRCRNLATDRDSVYEKYREKLEHKVKEHGLRDTNQLREVYKEKIEALKKENSIPIPIPSGSQGVHSFPASIQSPPPQPRSSTNPIPSSSTSAIKSLSAYVDVDKIRALPVKEVEAIWRLRHAQNAQSLCAVIQLPLYQKMEALAHNHPSFILPLIRENQGAEIHYLQWTFPAKSVATILFTHLAEFKLRGEYSQPHTTITHHLELAEEKGIVLLRGDVIEGRGVSVDEAKWLLFCLQKFYGGLGEDDNIRKRKGMVEMFGQGDLNFSVEELVQEAEKVV
ncbi:Protein ATP11, mitochondrial [Erysiphe neolycopersici]|uniref:Protein ATP11, mitochondrial n=1 Tax=Erysiphe neolycopersici TaxID=212602 RepID=A0A420HUW6_9PEZI|nr:Protein ATP11, mitochondrial [Erysiphe neolycopersici]